MSSIEVDIRKPEPVARAGQKRIAVIGGGMTGICAARHLLCDGAEPVIFETRARLGGLWNYSAESPDGKMYNSLCVNSNRHSMEFPDFKMPEEWFDYPRHFQILEYLHSYADKHSLDKYACLRSKVVDISEQPEGKWKVSYESVDGAYSPASIIVDGVMIATGQVSKAFVPNVPGQELFKGQTMHSEQFRTAQKFADKSVLIVGLGTATGPDISQELSYVARHVSVSSRRGCTFLPRYLLGVNRWSWFAGRTWWMYVPGLLATIKKVYFFILAWVYWFMFGNMRALGLRGYDPKLDSKDSCAPICTDSYCFPQRVKLGYITMRRGLKKFTADGMEFNDGQYQNFDTVIFATGYHRELPFTVNGGEFSFPDTPLYNYTFSTKHKNLGFCLFMHPIGPSFQCGWIQTKWISRVFNGKTALPAPAAMAAKAGALDAHQGKGGLDPFECFDSFTKEMGMGRPGVFGLISMMLDDSAKAIKYLMSPRWVLHVPIEKLCPSDTPAPESSTTVVKSITVPVGVKVMLGKASPAA